MRQHSPKQELPAKLDKAFSKGRPEEPPLLSESDKSILNRAPVSIRIEDFSQVKHRIDSLRQSGIVDLRKHFNRYPKELLNLAGMVRILWANDATLHFYEARNLSAFRNNLIQISDKNSYEVFKSEIVALAEGEAEFSSESVNITPRGQTKNFLLHVRVDPSHKDDLSRVFVVATDIKSIKQAEDELKRSEQMYRQVFESAMVPMVMLDGRTGIIVDSNSSFHQFVGSSAHALIGKHITQLCAESERKRSTELLVKLDSGGVPGVETLRLCHSEGREINVIVNASILRAEGSTYVLLIFSSAGATLPMWNRRATEDRRGLSTMRGKLSERERIILSLIATGHSNKSIGERLAISRKTVESHRLKIMHKLDIHKATDLVRYALTSGILVPD